MEISTPSGRTPTHARRPSALKAARVHDIAAEVVRCGGPVGEPHVDVVQPNVGARRDGTALEAGNVLLLCRPPRVADLEVADLELRIRAVACPRGAREPRALGNGEGAAAHAFHLDVFGCDV